MFLVPCFVAFFVHPTSLLWLGIPSKSMQLLNICVFSSGKAISGSLSSTQWLQSHSALGLHCPLTTVLRPSSAQGTKQVHHPYANNNNNNHHHHTPILTHRTPRRTHAMHNTPPHTTHHHTQHTTTHNTPPHTHTPHTTHHTPQGAPTHTHATTPPGVPHQTRRITDTHSAHNCIMPPKQASPQGQQASDPLNTVEEGSRTNDP